MNKLIPDWNISCIWVCGIVEWENWVRSISMKVFIVERLGRMVQLSQCFAVERICKNGNDKNIDDETDKQGQGLIEVKIL